VGTVERDFNQAGENFQRARNNAKEGNKLAVWWDYAPTTEKVMVGIGIAGLALVAYQIIRGK
jgi:type II secretory pathway component PulM